MLGDCVWKWKKILMNGLRLIPARKNVWRATYRMIIGSMTRIAIYQPNIMNKKIRIILSRIKWGLVKWYIGRKYHVSFGRRVEAYDCIYEGYHSIGTASFISRSYLGSGTYVSGHCVIGDSYIGRYCSIADDVAIGLASHPSAVWVTTYPAFYMNFNRCVNFTFHAGPEKYIRSKKRPGGTTARSDTTSGLAGGQQSYRE